MFNLYFAMDANFKLKRRNLSTQEQESQVAMDLELVDGEDMPELEEVSASSEAESSGDEESSGEE